MLHYSEKCILLGFYLQDRHKVKNNFTVEAPYSSTTAANHCLPFLLTSSSVGVLGVFCSPVLPAINPIQPLDGTRRTVGAESTGVLHQPHQERSLRTQRCQHSGA
ncbi:hypothetical protein CHARACLAT_024154 [Characodon lateralis]|uniref:Uncharacterized protein n=1 Tax=Characodon lateralis TaxID=208331 RepID=A0ABU7EMG0_9TELE|nr:hypothetical protein [Characodon lateralis]